MRRVAYRRRGETSWVEVTWPDGREVARLSRREVTEERVEVWVRVGSRLEVLRGSDAERVWAAR